MYYSQVDPKWKSTRLGSCTKYTIGSAGCLITSVANYLKRMDVVNITPAELNKLAIKKSWYADGCMLMLDKVAAHYGFKYSRQIAKPKTACIFETNYYKKVGVPQHFCLINESGKRLDPLDLEPSWESNNYPIVSYRIFTKIEAKKAPTPTQKPKEVKETTPEQKQPENAISDQIEQPETINTPIVQTPEVSAQKTEEIVDIPAIGELLSTATPTLLERIINFLLKIINKINPYL